MKLKYVLVVLLAAFGATVVFAQDIAASVPTSIPGLSIQGQLILTWGAIAIKYLAELYSSVRNGGGLKRIAMSFWFGESLPHVVAKDYAAELSTKKDAP